MRLELLALGGLVASLVVSACSGGDSNRSGSGTGGRAGSGGGTGSGGRATGTGGRSSSGGQPSAGGTGTGGNVSTGGAGASAGGADAGAGGTDAGAGGTDAGAGGTDAGAGAGGADASAGDAPSSCADPLDPFRGSWLHPNSQILAFRAEGVMAILDPTMAITWCTGTYAPNGDIAGTCTAESPGGLHGFSGNCTVQADTMTCPYSTQTPPGGTSVPHPIGFVGTRTCP